MKIKTKKPAGEQTIFVLNATDWSATKGSDIFQTVNAQYLSQQHSLVWWWLLSKKKQKNVQLIWPLISKTKKSYNIL